MAGKESVLYYSPEKGEKARKIKGVLVRLGIRIRNLTPDQIHEQIGTLAGLEDFKGKKETGGGAAFSVETLSPMQAEGESGVPAKESGTARIQDGVDAAALIPEEVLVFCNFGDASLDRLLRELHKSNASVALKAVLTETNCSWSFYELYREIRKEHAYMMQRLKEQSESRERQGMALKGVKE